MRSRTAMMAAVLTCGIGVLTACGGGAPGGAGAAGEVVIGDIASQSGQYSICGPSDVTLKIAVDEINAAGGIDVGGKKYTFRIESVDDQSDTAKASAAARQLLQSGAKIVFGPCGAGAASVLQFTRESQVVLVSAASSAAAAIKPGGEPQYLLTALPSVADREASAIAAVRQFRPAAKTMTMIGSDDPTFGAVVAEATTAWQAAGGTVSTVLYPPGTSDVAGFLAKVKDQNPDVLYIGQNPQSVTLVLQQLDAAGISKDVLVVGHGTEPALATKAGGRPFVATPFSPGPMTGAGANPATTQLVAKYLNASGQKDLPAFAPPIRYHYDIMRILAAAMIKAGTVDDMDAVLKGVLGQDLGYDGALGAVSFSESGFIRFPLVSTYVAPDGQQQSATWKPGT